MITDPNRIKPTGISLDDAYEAIRKWYQANIARIQPSGDKYWDTNSDYYRKSEDLIRRLPPASQTSDIEKLAVLGEVCWNTLEWGYWESDGKYVMSDYARAAFETYGRKTNWTREEEEELRKSFLHPFLKVFNREF